MTTATTAKSGTRNRRRGQLATVWLLTQQGQGLAGHADAKKAWAEKDATPPGSEARAFWFSPVEINIDPADAGRAVAKWEAIAGMTGVCHVEVHDRRPGDRRNEVH